MENNKSGIELIAEERKEQFEKHHRTIDEDVQLNNRDQLMKAVRQLVRSEKDRDGIEKAFNAMAYTTPDGWSQKIFSKMISKPYRERLIIAGALIAAEIDRLSALSNKGGGE